MEDESSGSTRKTVAIVAIFLVVGACAAVGGYLIGDSTGADLEAARVAGAKIGTKQGTAEGSKRGYAKGLKEGRERGYEKTYADAYRAAYAEAFKKADLEVPKEIEVPD